MEDDRSAEKPEHIQETGVALWGPELSGFYSSLSKIPCLGMEGFKLPPCLHRELLTFLHRELLGFLAQEKYLRGIASLSSKLSQTPAWYRKNRVLG
jgi:hypothetical protein